MLAFNLRLSLFVFQRSGQGILLASGDLCHALRLPAAGADIDFVRERAMRRAHVGDAFCRQHVLATGETMREERKRRGLSLRKVQERRQLLPLRIRKVEAFGSCDGFLLSPHPLQEDCKGRSTRLSARPIHRKARGVLRGEPFRRGLVETGERAFRQGQLDAARLRFGQHRP